MWSLTLDQGCRIPFQLGQESYGMLRVQYAMLHISFRLADANFDTLICKNLCIVVFPCASVAFSYDQNFCDWSAPYVIDAFSSLGLLLRCIHMVSVEGFVPWETNTWLIKNHVVTSGSENLVFVARRASKGMNAVAVGRQQNLSQI